MYEIKSYNSRNIPLSVQLRLRHFWTISIKLSEILKVIFEKDLNYI